MPSHKKPRYSSKSDRPRTIEASETNMFPSPFGSSTTPTNCLFHDLPTTLLGKIAQFLDRRSQARMEATCVRVCNMVRDELWSTRGRTFPESGAFLSRAHGIIKPAPTPSIAPAAATATRTNSTRVTLSRRASKRSIHKDHQFDQHNTNIRNNTLRLRFMILSNDHQRLVVYKSKRDRFNVGCLEIWDAESGCIACLRNLVCQAGTKPIPPKLSSDNVWMACGNLSQGGGKKKHCTKEGMLLVHSAKKESSLSQRTRVNFMAQYTVTTKRVLEDFENITSLCFIDNTTIVFSQLGFDGFLSFTARFVNGKIAVSDPEPYITYPIHSLNDKDNDPGHPRQILVQSSRNDNGQGGTLEEFSTIGYGRMAVYHDDKHNGRSLRAFVYSSYDNYIVIHDVTRNVYMTRTVPKETVEVFDLCFSPNGQRLVLSHFEHGLSILNCEAERIEDFGEIQIVQLSSTSDVKTPGATTTNNSPYCNNDSATAAPTNSSLGRAHQSGHISRSQYGYFAFSPDSQRLVALNMVPQKQFPLVVDIVEHLRCEQWKNDQLSWAQFWCGQSAPRG